MARQDADFTPGGRGGDSLAGAGIDQSTDVDDVDLEEGRRLIHQARSLGLLSVNPACWIPSRIIGTAFSALIRSVLMMRSKFLA